MSTTRTKTGGYHQGGMRRGVLFVLDGNWFNQRYRSGPIDYWGNRGTGLRASEAEDRVYSAEPTIPIGGVSAVHVFLNVKQDDTEQQAHDSSIVRELLIAAKTQGIPAYFYDRHDAWLAMDTRRTADIGQLTGNRKPTWYRPMRRRSYMQNWLELMGAKSQNQLSKDADRTRYNLNYDYDREEAAKSLANDMSNARKPDAGQDRDDAVKIIRYMQQHRLNTMRDFVDHIAAKWKAITNKPGVAEGFSNDMSTEDMIAYLRQHHDKNLHPDYLNHLTSTNSKFVLKNIPISSIKTELAGLDRAKVEQYKKMDFSKAPPIVVGSDGNILDGYHRATVAKALGIPTIKAYVGVKGQQGVAEGFNKDDLLDEAAPWVDKLGLGNFFRKIQNVDANNQKEIRILSGVNHSMQLYFKTILALNAQAGPAASLFWPLLGKQALLFAGGAAAYTIGKILATKLGRALFGSAEEALSWAQAHLTAGKNKESSFEFDGKQYPVTVIDPESIVNLEQQIAQLEDIVAHKRSRAASADYQKSLRQPKQAKMQAEGATVTRIDSKPITDFVSNLKAYRHTDDWSQSGVDTGDDSYWKKKNLKTNITKGLFAGEPHRTALYATGNAHETRYVEFSQNGQPIVYFDKKDLPAMRSRKTYLTVFDASNFKKLPTGEWFSENPGKFIKQTEIVDPFKYIADQGWIVRITDDLDKVFKQVKKMHQAGKIAHYGAEGMNESRQGVAEGLTIWGTGR